VRATREGGRVTEQGGMEEGGRGREKQIKKNVIRNASIIVVAI
jgi:hypothetical protein